MVLPPLAIMTAVSTATRPRSWSGTASSRRRAPDRAWIRPVRSAVSRRVAAPAWVTTWSPPAVTVNRRAHRVESCTRKVPSGTGSSWRRHLRFSQPGGTFLYPLRMDEAQDPETPRYRDLSLQDNPRPRTGRGGWWRVRAGPSGWIYRSSGQRCPHRDPPGPAAHPAAAGACGWSISAVRRVRLHTGVAVARHPRRGRSAGMPLGVQVRPRRRGSASPAGRRVDRRPAGAGHPGG
jgi:hypothetical protein